ncbi:hypothetical protein ACI76O_03710 [Capnocytophaga cynodegmi]|uniref:hypothetical protein n=1 Tax=Capnocytophaga cynodegmi TaxID=28189 RepID=UPI00385EAAD4
MKTNNKLQRNLAKFLGIFALTALLTSCGSYYVYYNDGIYGELPPERVTIVERYDNYPSRSVSVPQSKYRDYFREKALQYSDTQESFTHFTDVDSYTSDFYTNPERKAYAGWGNNPTQVTVNVYDNNWGYPYHRYNSYWGYGAWYPYDNYYYGYYPYHRNHFNWGFSIGWGNYYNPYWNWYDRYGYYDRGYYPYYGYGYYPYYGGRYYPRYYNDRRYYDRGYYYGNDSRRYSPTVGRRGDNNRYNNDRQRNYSRSYSPNNSDSRSYNRRNDNDYNYNNRNYDNSSRSYSPNRDYNNNSSRSYSPSSNGNSGNRSNGSSGTTRRSY